jgi:hypothetical protein
VSIVTQAGGASRDCGYGRFGEKAANVCWNEAADSSAGGDKQHARSGTTGRGTRCCRPVSVSRGLLVEYLGAVARELSS